MNNIDFAYLGVIGILLLMLFVQHTQLEKDDAQIASFAVQQKLAADKEKAVASAAVTANKVAIQAVTQANKDTAIIMQEHVSSDCEKAMQWAIKNAQELNK